MSFPIQIDLEFHLSKQALPVWAQKVQAAQDAKAKRAPWSADCASTIDIIVNAHAGVRHSSGEMAAHNLLAIVRGYRRRGIDLENKLRFLAGHPECLIDPKKRAAFARKWATRIARGAS